MSLRNFKNYHSRHTSIQNPKTPIKISKLINGKSHFLRKLVSRDANVANTLPYARTRFFGKIFSEPDSASRWLHVHVCQSLLSHKKFLGEICPETASGGRDQYFCFRGPKVRWGSAEKGCREGARVLGPICHFRGVLPGWGFWGLISGWGSG